MKNLTKLIAVFLLFSCKINSKDKIAGHQVEENKSPVATKAKTVKSEFKKNDQALSNEDAKKRIIGIWISKYSYNGNANFSINDSDFFDPETNNHYPYKIMDGKIKVDYEDGPDTSSFKFRGNDTLIMTGQTGTIVYHRVKE
jgi:hypothetical protein